MNIKQLIVALEKIHPDFWDQDLIVMSVDEKGQYTYQLLAFSGVVVKGDLSFAVLGTAEAAQAASKEGKAKDIKTGKIVTEEDTKLPTEDEN